jgi:ABC-type transport system substrate-binding protein
MSFRVPLVPLMILVGVWSSPSVPQARAAVATMIQHPAVVSATALGQRSLLDLDDEEEPPPKPAIGEAPRSRAEPGEAAQADPAGSRKGLEPEEEPALEPSGKAATPTVPDGIPKPPPPDRADRHRGLAEEEDTEWPPVCDIVYASLSPRGSMTPRRVELLPHLIRPPFPAARQYEFKMIASGGTGYLVIRPFGVQVSSIRYYEEMMLERAAQEFGVKTHELSESGKRFPGLSDPQRAAAAERTIDLLQMAIAEHDSAVQRFLRIGPQWRELRDALCRAWFNVNMSQIEAAFQQQQYPHALAACDRLRGHPALKFEDQGEVREVLEQILLGPAGEAIDRGDYAEAQRLLDELQRRYPLAPGGRAAAVQQRLTGIARSLAKRAVAEKDPRLLDEAASVWPQLQGLDQLRRQIVEDYPVLHISSSVLPNGLSPLSAQSVVDRYAVSLMFESLVRWKSDPLIGPHYTPQLAAGRPEPLARGRRFRLPRCAWSETDDGTLNLCTQEDVFWTVQLLTRLKPPGYPRAWESLFAGVDNSQTADPFQVAMVLKHDYWQPLSLMDFKVMPKSSFPQGGNSQEVEAFNQHPVGTGPYRLQKVEPGRRITFNANPYYRKPGLPRIREIVWHRMDDIEAHNEFLKGNLHLICGVRPTQVVELRNQRKNVVTLPTPQVSFLAVNHRHRVLQNLHVRRALAHGIDRQRILDTCFRAGHALQDHAPLNGPYPPSSWAFNPRVPAYDPASAATFVKLAQDELGGQVPQLRLLYPDRDPAVGQACSEMQRQWAAVGLKVEIQAFDPLLFPRLVTERHAFELAYWTHGYEDESYWIWPWFDPEDVGPNGSNYLGYIPPEELHSLFAELVTKKQFLDIRAATHKIHGFLADRAVIIPLWQLDTYVAVSPLLKAAKFDSFRFFDEVEQWSVTSK